MIPTRRWYPSTLICFGFMASMLIPAVWHAGGGIRLPWVLFMAWAATVLLERTDTVRTTLNETLRRLPEIVAFTCWFFVVFANFALGRGYTASVHLVVVTTVAMTISMTLVYAGRRDGSYGRLVFALCVLLGLESLRALPALMETFGLARMLMAVDPDPAVMVSAMRRGIGDYANYTGMAIILPVFVALASLLRGWRRIAGFFFVATIAAAISVATFMGAFLLLGIGVSYLTVVAVVRSRSIVGGALAATLVAASVVVWLNTAGDSAQARFVLDKAGDLLVSTREEGLIEGETTGRGELFSMSMVTFVRSPLFGVGPVTLRENPVLHNQVGGHSSWVDHLAEYGIAGFGFFIAYLLLAHRRNRSNTLGPRGFASSAVFIVMPLYIIGGLVNPVVMLLPIIVPFCFIGLGSSDALAAGAGPVRERRHHGRRLPPESWKLEEV